MRLGTRESRSAAQHAIDANARSSVLGTTRSSTSPSKASRLVVAHRASNRSPRSAATIKTMKPSVIATSADVEDGKRRHGDEVGDLVRRGGEAVDDVGHSPADQQSEADGRPAPISACRPTPRRPTAIDERGDRRHERSRTG